MKTRAVQLSVLVAFSCVCPETKTPELLWTTTKVAEVTPSKDPTVVRRQNVIVDLGCVRDGGKDILRMPLFGDESLVLQRDRIEGLNGQQLWVGRVANEPASNVTLSPKGEALIGNIKTQAGRIYQIRYLGRGVHELREIDQSKFPREAPPRRIRPPSTPQPAADTCSTDPPTDIDVMVVYTGDARAAAGGTEAMQASVYLAVSEANQSYVNSNVTQRLRLVHVEEVSYAESGNIDTDLDRLQNGSDGFMDNVPTLRNTHAADVVSLITEDGGGFCGLGYMMETISNAFESYAYSVVARSCATGYYSFAHELGHNMGADHDCANATSTGPAVYNHGWVNTAPTAPATPWRTIMSYNGSPSSTRVQYWSNPNVNYPVGGDAMGSLAGACQADDHQILEDSALAVANFRCSSPGASNVWMRDTWNDTGAEPDPLTAGEDMWQSPYIWVRHAQDVARVHQHEHENPEFGQPHWVYVKLHNGFSSAASGNLELYFAKASTGLSWQADWTLLASIPVAAFAAHSTQIVEAAWDTLPGTGHYCMVARWNSAADPMTAAETTDINANVRANNNIVWRNLNIVDLSADISGDAQLVVRNPDRQRRLTTTVLIKPSRRDAQQSFIGLGQVVVQLDETLMKAWKAGGGKGNGFMASESGLALVDPRGAVLQGLQLDPGAAGNLRLTFKKGTGTPKRDYVIDVVQASGEVGSVPDSSMVKGILGGVSYEIRTAVRPKKRT